MNGSSWRATICGGRFSGSITGPGGGDHRLLDDVLELAHVPRPVVGEQPRQGQPRDRPARQPALGQLLEEVLHEQRDVLEPVAERGQLDREDVEPVVQVLAEPAGGDGLGEVDVRRGDDPAIGLDRLGAADALEPPVLEHAQELGLHAHRHVADLVEEERAAPGQLEPPFLLAVGAGEGPALVAEELGLEQVLGQGRAVDRQQRFPAGSRR